MKPRGKRKQAEASSGALLAFLGEESAERNIVCTSFRVEAINTRENLKKNGSIVGSSAYGVIEEGIRKGDIK